MIQKNFILALIGALSMAACQQIQAASKSLCKEGETPFFSCHVNSKTISLCMPQQGATPDYLEYRFGTPKKIEMSFRADNSSKRRFLRTEVTYASNESTIIWFKNAEVNYLIHFPMRGAPQLDVMKNGLSVATMACKSDWESSTPDGKGKSSFIDDVPGGDVGETSHYWEGPK